MPATYVERVLVPDAARTRLLVVGDASPAPPSWSWRRLQAVFEPDGAYPFVDLGVQRHLELALAASARLD